MIDSKNGNKEDFVISSEYEEHEPEELTRDEFYGNHTNVLRKKPPIPFIIGGIGLAVLVIILFFMYSGQEGGNGKEQLRSIEARVQQLEGKLATIGVIDQALDRLAKQEQKFSELGKRVDRLEGTVKTQIDQIIKELGKIHQKTTQSKTSKSPAPQPAADLKKETKPEFHVVRAGETLYGISRLYGLTVEQLRKYNNIGPNAAIQPGQKLNLSQ
jgi:LysM repeat protein